MSLLRHKTTKIFLLISLLAVLLLSGTVAAQTEYNCGTYGGGNYGTGDAVGTDECNLTPPDQPDTDGDGIPDSSDPDSLTNTGDTRTWIIMGGSALLILAAILVVVGSRRKQKNRTQPPAGNSA